MLVSRDDIRPGAVYSEHNLRNYQCAECGWSELVVLWYSNNLEEIVCANDHRHKEIEKRPYQPPASIYHENALEMRWRNKERWAKAEKEKDDD